MARTSRKNQPDVSEKSPQKIAFRAGAYVRQSVDKKDRGETIETQQAIINAFLTEYPDIELKDVYIDNGHSGQSFERPSFQRMIADIESGRINCCVTKDLSRLGRNAIDSGYYVEKFFPSKGVRFIAITDNYDSANGNGGGIMVSLKNMINEAYALDISRKIKSTFRMNISKGAFVAGSAPYGYLKSREDCHKLVVDEYSASIVRRIFEMAAEKKPHKDILAWLNNNEIIPPRRYLHSIGAATGKEVGAQTKWWNLRAVRDILRNQMYCGDMIQGKSQIVGGIQKKLPKSEWTITENTHTAIVTREIFAEAQKFWNKQSRPTTPEFRTPKTENIFMRKLLCGKCGHFMVRKRLSEWSYAFVCNTSKLYTEMACDGNRLTEKYLRGVILEMLRKHEPLLPQTENLVAVTDNPQKSGLSSIKSEINRNSRFLTGLYESLVLGDITESEYKDMKGAYETKISQLSSQENELQRAIRHQAKLSQVNKSIQSVGEATDLTEEIIERLVEKITAYKNGRIKVKFSFMEEISVGGEVAAHE